MTEPSPSSGGYCCLCCDLCGGLPPPFPAFSYSCPSTTACETGLSSSSRQTKEPVTFRLFMPSQGNNFTTKLLPSPPITSKSFLQSAGAYLLPPPYLDYSSPVHQWHHLSHDFSHSSPQWQRTQRSRPSAWQMSENNEPSAQDEEGYPRSEDSTSSQ